MSQSSTKWRNLKLIRSQLDSLSIEDSPWVKYLLIPEFSGFPRDIASIIVDFLQIFKLRDWIPEEKLDKDSLCINPNAFLAGMIPDWKLASQKHISSNPFAIDYIKQNTDSLFGFSSKWENPKVVEWLFSIGIYPTNHESIDFLRYCKSKMAVDWILGNLPLAESIGHLSANHFAIDVLRQSMDLVDRDRIWGNCAAVDILQARIAAGDEIDWHWLSWNSSPWAMDLLNSNRDKIKWVMISENPSIFEIADHPDKKRLINILTDE